MRDADLFRALGFVRLGDYVAEKLGVSLRDAQEMMRVDEALEVLPLASAEFEAGGITAGHVRILTRVATPDDEAYWVALARRVSVKALARAAASRQCEGGACAQGDGATGDSYDADDHLRHDVSAPAWVAGWWRETAVLVRRLAGSALPAGEAFAMVVAEIASGGAGTDHAAEETVRTGALPGLPRSAHIPDVAHFETAPPEKGAPGDGVDSGLPRSASCHDGLDAASLAAAIRIAAASENEELPASASPSAIPDAATDAAPRPENHPRAASLDAREVDRELRELFCERRSQDALLAEHFHLVGRGRTYLGEGFRSLEEYAAERYGLPARSLYRLLALHRAFERIPRLRRAFLSRRLTARQVVCISPVATRATLVAWMKRAEAVSLKRLEDEIDFWVHLKESRPAVWSRLEGLPLPFDLSLAPGRAPRLPSSAPEGKVDDASGHVPAASLLRALEQDEAATPLPERMCVITLWLDPEVRDQWLSVLSEMRASCGENPGVLKEWQALVLVLKEVWKVWDNALTRRQRRENPILERDGWRCMVPWCRSVGTGRLHVHHIIPRSEGGGDETWNRLTLCVGCHLGLLHEGRIRVTGRAPDDLVWELGLEPGREPFAIFRGHRRVDAGRP